MRNFHWKKNNKKQNKTSRTIIKGSSVYYYKQWSLDKKKILEMAYKNIS